MFGSRLLHAGINVLHSFDYTSCVLPAQLNLFHGCEGMIVSLIFEGVSVKTT